MGSWTLDGICEAIEESGHDAELPLVFVYDGLRLDIGEIKSDGETVRVILEEDI